MLNCACFPQDKKTAASKRVPSKASDGPPVLIDGSTVTPIQARLAERRLAKDAEEAARTAPKFLPKSAVVPASALVPAGTTAFKFKFMLSLSRNSLQLLSLQCPQLVSESPAIFQCQ